MPNTNYMDDPEKVLTDGEKKAAESDKLYDGMIADNNKTQGEMLGKISQNQATQEQIQNEKTNFAIEEINQQKDQAHKDYIKEQSGAYTDWQKAKDPYGVNAEARASQGMSNTGYSESSQVAMYTAYQNRVATARESYDRAVLAYNNAITNARLQNNAVLAEIAAEALAQQLEITMSFVQQNNSLLTQKANARTTISQNYYNRYMAVLDQIYKEDSMAEQKRQFEAQMAEEKRQFDILHSSSGGGSGGGGGNSGGSVSAKDYIDKNATVDKSKSDTKNENTSSGGKKVDQASIRALGYGAISAKRLDELIRQGKVIEYLDPKTMTWKYKRAGLGGNIMNNKTSNKTTVPQIASYQQLKGFGGRGM